MKIKSYIMTVIIMMTVITSCRQQGKEQVSPLEDTTSFKELKGERILSDYPFVFPQSLLSTGNGLIVGDARTETLLLAFDSLNDSTPIGIGARGMGPDEFMNRRCMYYNAHDSVLYIHDTVLRRAKYFKYDESRPELTGANTVREISLRDSRANDTRPAGELLVTDLVSGNTMFALVDSTGSVRSRFGIYPGDKSGIEDSTSFAMGHQTILTVNTAGDRAVVAGRNSDWLAFYEISDDGGRLITESMTFESPVEVLSEEDGDTRTVSTRDLADTRTRFTDLIATPRYVYAVYSGSTAKEREDKTAKPMCVLKYDWNGTFIEGFRFAEQTGAKTVTPDDRFIIAVTQGDKDEMILKQFELSN